MKNVQAAIYKKIRQEHILKASIVALLWGSTCCVSSASVSTHFTLHFHSAAFHIPPHQGAEGGGTERLSAFPAIFLLSVNQTRSWRCTWDSLRSLGEHQLHFAVIWKSGVWKAKHTEMTLLRPLRKSNGKWHQNLFPSAHVTCLGT